MSTKLVRRLLQQTDEIKFINPEEQSSRKRKKSSGDRVPVDKEQVVQEQVQSLLFLDNVMASNRSHKIDTAKRIQEEHKKERKVRKNSSKVVVGNSRASSSGMISSPIPTFDKKKYRKEKEERRLQHIAKLLKKNAQKSSK